jgi:hypothetical protein
MGLPVAALFRIPRWHQSSGCPACEVCKQCADLLAVNVGPAPFFEWEVGEEFGGILSVERALGGGPVFFFTNVAIRSFHPRRWQRRKAVFGFNGKTVECLRQRSLPRLAVFSVVALEGIPVLDGVDVVRKVECVMRGYPFHVRVRVQKECLEGHELHVVVGVARKLDEAGRRICTWCVTLAVMDERGNHMKRRMPRNL